MSKKLSVNEIVNHWYKSTLLGKLQISVFVTVIIFILFNNHYTNIYNVDLTVGACNKVISLPVG